MNGKVNNIMSKNKLLIILFIIAYISLLIGITQLDKNSVSGYIVYSNIGSFKCKNLDCKNTTNSKISDLNKDKKMLSVYYFDEYKGKFYGNYNEKWNMFTENGRLTVLPEGFIGFSTSLNAEFTYLNSRELTEVEKQELDYVLRKKNFTHNYKVLLNRAFDYDLNNDGKIDTIYCISNFDYVENVKNQFSILYTKINNKINVIDYKYSETSYELPTYDISGLVKIKNENALIINELYFDQVADSYVHLYKLKNNKLTNISSISNNVSNKKKVEDEYVFNFENEFVNKCIPILIFTGIMIGVGSIAYLKLENKRKNSNEI